MDKIIKDIQANRYVLGEYNKETREFRLWSPYVAFDSITDARDTAIRTLSIRQTENTNNTLVAILCFVGGEGIETRSEIISL